MYHVARAKSELAVVVLVVAFGAGGEVRRQVDDVRDGDDEEGVTGRGVDI